MNNKKKTFYMVVLIVVAVILTNISIYKDMKIENHLVENKTNTDEVIEQKNVEIEVSNSVKNTENQEIEKNNTTVQNVIEENTITKKSTTRKITNNIENIYKSTYDKSKFNDRGFLNKYPKYTTEYGTLKISKINVNAPISFGNTQEIIKDSVGHDPGSYFVGENGSIILCGHNYKFNFSKFGELENGDIIEIKTDYGDFFYKMYDSKVILDTEGDKLEIQRNEEILMIYTCYPFNNSAYTEYRYVVFAKKI